MTKSSLFGALAALTLMALPAWAAPNPTLSFTTPSAIVGPNDDIPVFLTLSLAPGSDALIIGENDMVSSGYDSSVLPDGFNVDAVVMQQTKACTDTFTGACANMPYNFTFFKVAAQAPLFPNLNLQPGESTSFLFGTFTPSQGPVAEGLYSATSFGLTLQFTDFSQPDPNEPQSAENDSWTFPVTYAGTCETQGLGCGFQRTVAAVPEPETYAMLLAGLGLIGWRVKRRSI